MAVALFGGTAMAQENSNEPVLIGKNEAGDSYYIYPKMVAKNDMGYSVGWIDIAFAQPQYDEDIKKNYILRRNQWLVDCKNYKISDISYAYYSETERIDSGERSAEEAIPDLQEVPKESVFGIFVEEICKYSK